jgi:uncharacterized protein (TIGR02145 family)
MKTIFLLSFFLLAGISYSQSKKEQIELLINRLDSLNQVLSSERSASSQKVSEFNATISNLESKISSLNATISNLNLELQTSKTDASSKQTELNSKQQEITNLQAQVKQKTDSLALVRAELEKLKPAPKPVVTNSTNQVTQTGSYKSVKIGTQTWMTENLNVSTFRNGDPIPEAKTDEEWKKAGENKQPAWCYYDNDPKNGAKYGKLYNWFAVNDARGLAPEGWHIPSDAEWRILENYLGEESAGHKMKSTSGWDNNGNGTNSSGFSGLAGGFRHSHGDFYRLGIEGCWYSSSLGYKGNPDALYIWNDEDFFARDSQFGDLGNSVRCLKD